ncbi:MAG: hypothetical protein PHR28_03060, partial [candidate division Zixibacteria bacterium]|nr:hypothetical protein [candidate division Zixibacteria bacterium]
MKREIPLAITFTVGIVFALVYFIPHRPFSDFQRLFGDWFGIISAFAIWLGALNLMKISSIKLIRRQPGKWYAVVIIVSFLIMAFCGFFEGFKGINSQPQYSYRDPGTAFNWMYLYVYS